MAVLHPARRHAWAVTRDVVEGVVAMLVMAVLATAICSVILLGTWRLLRLLAD